MGLNLATCYLQIIDRMGEMKTYFFFSENSHHSYSNNTKYVYRRVMTTSLLCLEAHAGFFRLFMKGKFDVYSLWPFGKS